MNGIKLVNKLQMNIEASLIMSNGQRAVVHCFDKSEDFVCEHVFGTLMEYLSIQKSLESNVYFYVETRASRNS